MSNKCPRCNSNQVSTRQVGRTTGMRLGALTAAALAVVNVTRGAQTGAILCSFAGPPGMVTGGLAGAVLAGLFAGSAGGAIGGAMGKIADETFLDNRMCSNCGHTFRTDDDDVPVAGPFVAPGSEFAGQH